MSKEYRCDQDFKTGKWFELRKFCPTFFSILEFQFPVMAPVNANYNTYKTPELDLRIVLAFIGRLWHRVNTLEKWQKGLAFIGTSGNGKTTLLELIISYFGKYVFMLKNVTEQKFGWETAINMYLCVIEELSSETGIPGSEMLNMLCGSKSFVASRKGQSQHNMTFDMPVLAAGNSFPHTSKDPANPRMTVWPNDQQQTERRWVIPYFDRKLKPGTKIAHLPDLLASERAAILVLCNRAYHNLIRTLGDEHVDLMLTPDLWRDTSEVIAGTSDTNEFLRESGLVWFDKGGIRRSQKFMPLDALLEEWGQFQEARHGKKRSKKMTKRQFFSILEVTGATMLIRKDADRKKGTVSTFGFPKYTLQWPIYDNSEYAIKGKTITKDTRTRRAWIVGIDINPMDCPRLNKIGTAAAAAQDEEDWSSYHPGGGGSSSSSSAAGGVEETFKDRMARVVAGEDGVLTATERKTQKAALDIIKGSESYNSSLGINGVRVDKSYLGDFQVPLPSPRRSLSPCSPQTVTLSIADHQGRLQSA
jgi:hypothetical protein